MPKSSKLQSLLVVMLCMVGLLPLLFFVSIEMGIAEASVDSSQMSKTEFDPYIENVAFGVSEKLTFGDKLASERELTKKYSVSSKTIKAAPNSSM